MGPTVLDVDDVELYSVHVGRVGGPVSWSRECGTM